MRYSEYSGKNRRRIQKILFYRRKNRKILKWRKKQKRHYKQHRVEYRSCVLMAMQKSTNHDNFNWSDDTVYLKVPNVFCFSRKPDVALEFINKVYTSAINTKVKSLYFDHTDCNIVGVCASTIMDIVLLHCNRWRKSINSPLRYYGYLLPDNRISKNAEVDKLLKASGILKHLGIYSDTMQEVECLNLIENGQSSQVAEKIIDYINRALSRHNLSLSPLGVNYFGQLLGEIADNCSQHGGEDVIWYTLGHYYFNKESNEGKCQLVILDFGDTIYEGLKNSATTNMRKRIKNYVHKAWTFFPIRMSEETLYTLFSLQQRVSRFEQKGVVRGNGTITFLDAFQNLFNTNDFKKRSMLSITSGHCSILFDGTYTLSEKTYSNGYKNKIIAFNKDNNLQKPPDKHYVRTLKNRFPGTIISMELYIDNTLIYRKEHNNEKN